MVNDIHLELYSERAIGGGIDSSERLTDPLESIWTDMNNFDLNPPFRFEWPDVRQVAGNLIEEI